MEWKYHMTLSKKKIKVLFNIDNNKSTKSCSPCMDVCEKVDRKINGRELSKISNKEITEILKISVSS